MARSKKDGRQGAGHRALRKWQKTSARRRAQRNRRRNIEMALSENLAEIEADMLLDMQEQAALYNEDQGWDWVNDYLDWQGLNDAQYSDEDLEYGHYDPYDQYRNEDYEGLYDREWPDQYDVMPDIFQAVDRAVRRHGVEHVRKQASMLAAALDVSGYEIQRCISLTSAGYINA
jgi:hypothetical protein